MNVPDKSKADPVVKGSVTSIGNDEVAGSNPAAFTSRESVAQR